jgi:hypothetical protein
LTRRAIIEKTLELLNARRRELEGERNRLLEAEALARSEFKIGDVVECHYGRSARAYSGRPSTETWRRYQVTAIKPSRVGGGITLFGRQFLKNGKLSDAVTDLEWKHPRLAQ